MVQSQAGDCAPCGAKRIAVNAQHEVISTRLFVGQTLLHVLSDQDPAGGFRPVPPGLAEFYMATIKSAREAA
jgi:ABC-2 type transport system ATP-binding protein